MSAGFVILCTEFMVFLGAVFDWLKGTVEANIRILFRGYVSMLYVCVQQVS